LDKKNLSNPQTSLPKKAISAYKHL